jgi:hypothetical protein
MLLLAERQQNNHIVVRGFVPFFPPPQYLLIPVLGPVGDAACIITLAANSNFTSPSMSFTECPFTVKAWAKND